MVQKCVESCGSQVGSQLSGVCKGQTCDDGDEAHDRADREIDAAGDDDHRHADGHDAEQREIAAHISEVLHRAEGMGLIDRHAEIEYDQCHRHPEGLAGEELVQPGLLAALGDVSDCGVTGFGDGLCGFRHLGSLPLSSR
jgi:hypothetical protein